MPALCTNMSWVTVIRSSSVRSAGEGRLTPYTSIIWVKYFSKKFPYSKLLARHVEAYHRKVDGLRCSFEQCTVKSKRLEEIRNHVRQAHSVKNPALGSHIMDEYSSSPVIPREMYDQDEPDLASIYECLDEQIDFDVLRSTNDSTIEGRRVHALDFF